MSDKILNLLGLACRAGKTVCGDGAAQKTLKKKSVPLLFLAADGGNDNVTIPPPGRKKGNRHH